MVRPAAAIGPLLVVRTASRQTRLRQKCPCPANARFFPFGSNSKFIIHHLTFSCAMFYLTTAIDYTNGSPHIGHAYEKVLADVIARYRRLRGDEAFFLTGVDQHGQKVQQTAEKEGVHPATFVKRTTKKFLNLWEKLGVNYDGWAETTDAAPQGLRASHSHRRSRTRANSTKTPTPATTRCARNNFYQTATATQSGDFGPEWGEVVVIEEENWYFKLSEHTDWLQSYLEATPDAVLPVFRKAELLNALERNSGTDLCISRPKERLRWGIEFPFDPDYRHLCLVRRAHQLHLLRRLPRRAGRRAAGFHPALDRRRAPGPYHRQGHPGSRPRHLLALHAPRHGLSRRRKCPACWSTAGGTSAAKK